MSDTKKALREETQTNEALGGELDKLAKTRSTTLARVAPENRAEALLSNASGAPITPMFLIDGDPDAIEGADAFAKAQEEMRKEREARLAVKTDLLDKEYTFFVKCRHPHPEGLGQHGIYLRGYPPSRIVKGTDWKSGYKPKLDEPWHGEEILCQVCLRYENRNTPLPVTPMRGPGLPAGSFEVDPRWLWKRPKDARRLAIENETRVLDVGWATGNIGRVEAENRAKAAGFQVVN